MPRIFKSSKTDENDITAEIVTILLSDHFLVFSFNKSADARRVENPMPSAQVIVIGFASTPNYFTTSTDTFDL